MKLDDASVIVCTHEASPRLRLVLRALTVQDTAPREVIVVDDRSTDGTAELLEEARAWFPAGVLRPLCLAENLGSPGARNAGAHLASGDLSIFLDADALPTRGHVRAHLEEQRRRGGCALFGALWHTTTTEFLRDPSTGETFDVDVPADVRARLANEPASMLVTEQDVTERFDAIVERSAQGTYPHLGPAEREADALGDADGHGAAWMLMSPQNFSVPRASFESVDGFDGELPFCEGWDLVLRLREAGVAPLRLSSPPIYHLYHYRALGSFKEPLRRYRAMKRIGEKMGQRSIALAAFYYHCLGGDPWLPRELALGSLDRMAEVFRTHRGDDLGEYGPFLAGHPLFAELEEAITQRPTTEGRA